MGAVETIKAIEAADLSTFLKDIPADLVVRGVQAYSRPLFVRYFKGYRIQMAAKRVREMVDHEVVGKGSEELGQLLSTLWNRANGRLYHAMYNKVRTVDENVDRIERIDDEKAEGFMAELLGDHDATRIYLCILFNEVKFSKEAIEKKLGKKIPIDPWPPKPTPEEAQAEAPAPESK
jgi:hypothetical protein